MSLETLLSDLIAAIKDNTSAHSAGGKAEPAKEDRGASRRGSGKDEPAKEDRGSSRRGADKEKAKDEPKDEPKGISEADLKEKARKFLDLPDNADGNTEYDKRLEKVIDPIFDKGGAKELADLPEKYWDELADAIDAYEKEAGGSRRRR